MQIQNNNIILVRYSTNPVVARLMCESVGKADPLLFLLYTSELFWILENKLIGYADDSTLMAVVPSPCVRVAVAESLIRDLGRVSEWCDLWGM